MSSLGLAKGIYSAFNGDKPHSSISQWVDILTSDKYGGEAYEGIPELVDSIKLQPSTGTGEASRAIRKKLKHGDTHQQYRALVILKALVENCGPRFQSSFADSQLTDAIRHMATDSTTDARVKKKLLQVLASWHDQFKDDPGMSFVANLYKSVKPERPKSIDPAVAAAAHRQREEEEERRRRDERDRQDEARRKADREKEQRALDKIRAERERLEREAQKKSSKNKSKDKGKPKRKWNYETEKPLILSSIATASQASSNLVNAITLVNTENDSLPNNPRVQECLQAAKDSRKKIVRYIQLVENEELMGTLIETNERIIASMEMYDTLSKPIITEKDVDNVAKDLAKANIHDSQIGRLQEKQRAAVSRAIVRQNSNQAVRSPSNTRGKERAYEQPTTYDYDHPDLHDLDFGSGSSAQPAANHQPLQPPIRPSVPGAVANSDYDRRGSLSDFSDYDSSEEDLRAQTSGAGGSRAPIRQSGWDTGSRSASKARAYAGLPEEDEAPPQKKGGKLVDSEDPFADPFAD